MSRLSSEHGQVGLDVNSEGWSSLFSGVFLVAFLVALRLLLAPFGAVGFDLGVHLDPFWLPTKNIYMQTHITILVLPTKNICMQIHFFFHTYPPLAWGGLRAPRPWGLGPRGYAPGGWVPGGMFLRRGLGFYAIFTGYLPASRARSWLISLCVRCLARVARNH